jgi:hypothetical protein
MIRKKRSVRSVSSNVWARKSVSEILQALPSSATDIKDMESALFQKMRNDNECPLLCPSCNQQSLTSNGPVGHKSTGVRRLQLLCNRGCPAFYFHSLAEDTEQPLEITGAIRQMNRKFALFNANPPPEKEHQDTSTKIEVFIDNSSNNNKNEYSQLALRTEAECSASIATDVGNTDTLNAPPSPPVRKTTLQPDFVSEFLAMREKLSQLESKLAERDLLITALQARIRDLETTSPNRYSVLADNRLQHGSSNNAHSAYQDPYNQLEQLPNVYLADSQYTTRFPTDEASGQHHSLANPNPVTSEAYKDKFPLPQQARTVPNQPGAQRKQTAAKTRGNTKSRAQSRIPKLDPVAPSVDWADSVQDKPRQSRTKSFADAAKTELTEEEMRHREVLRQRARDARLALRMSRTNVVPQEFYRIHVRLRVNEMFLRMSAAEKTKFISRTWTKALKIHNKVALASRIGNSVVELYVCGAQRDAVITALNNAGVKIETELDLTNFAFSGPVADKRAAAVRRLGHLYNRAWTARMREAVVKGFSTDFIDEVKKFATLLNATTPTMHPDSETIATPQAQPMDISIIDETIPNHQ